MMFKLETITLSFSSNYYFADLKPVLPGHCMHEHVEPKTQNKVIKAPLSTCPLRKDVESAAMHFDR